MITIKFDDREVTDAEIINLSDAIQKIVSEATDIKDVFVYADSPKIKVAIAPIEIFVEMSASKIEDAENLLKKITERTSTWKNQNNFQHSINITLNPMNWIFETGI